MKSIIILVVIFLFSAIAVKAAAPSLDRTKLYTVKKEGYPACNLKTDLQKFLILGLQKDVDAMWTMTQEKKCYKLRGGRKVYIMDEDTEHGLIKIRPKGFKYDEAIWTIFTAVE